MTLKPDGEGTAASRARPRFKLFQPTMMVVGKDLVRVHLLDLSATGALLHHATPPEVGSTMRLECAGNMRLARVVWVSGTRFGIAFTMPLSEGQVTEALADQSAMVAAHAQRVGAVA